jgi:hypothetical protein
VNYIAVSTARSCQLHRQFVKSMAKPAITLLLLALAAPAMPAAVIRGLVVENRTGYSVSRATVTLQPIPSAGQAPRTARTGDAGEFAFGNVFKMTYHSEERPMSAYSLVAAKPKMKKADPASRIFCRNSVGAAGSPPGSQTITCQNTTMALLAERLQNQAQGLNWPILDATGIDGGWDFTLTYSRFPALNGPGRGGDAGVPDAAPVASDPGGGYTIFEAIDKQLGLKLESRKRPMPVIVIDHLEQKPTDN